MSRAQILVDEAAKMQAKVAQLQTENAELIEALERLMKPEYIRRGAWFICPHCRARNSEENIRAGSRY